MSQNFKKLLERNETYIDKNHLKHKHNYIVKHLLIITNINEHASANQYGKKKYYYILKCNECNSFIPDHVAGNYNHVIFNMEDIDNSLPIIVANTLQKCPHYSFSKLIDVKIKEN